MMTGRHYNGLLASDAVALTAVRAEAHRRALRERCPLYLYGLRDGGYWISEADPKKVAGWTGDLKFIEKFEPRQAPSQSCSNAPAIKKQP